MANFCTRCGKPLEKDGFCMNCMDFARKSENVQGTATDYQENMQMSYDTNSAEQNAGQWSNQADQMIQGNSQMIEESRTKTPASRYLLAIILSIVVCVAGILVIVKFADDPDKSSFVESESYTVDELYDNVQVDNEEDYDVGQEDEVEAFEDDASIFNDSAEVYEADYDEIMQAGEPSNGYNLFSVKKDDIVPVMDEYFSRYKMQANFSSSMDNTYEMVGDEKSTYYETYSIWDFEEEENSMYCVATDTVTSNVLYIGIYLDNKEDAIELVRESLVTIDPSLSEEQLQETCESIADESDLVEADCGNYYVYGGYTGAEEDKYYYYIFSLVEN